DDISFRLLLTVVLCELLLVLLLILGRDRERIGAERRGGQPVLVPQVDHRVGGPAVANGDRLGHLFAGDDDRLTVDRGGGRVELFVFAGDGESGQRSVLGEQSAADVLEAERDFVTVDGHAVVERSGVLEFFAVAHGAGGQGQALPDRL